MTTYEDIKNYWNESGKNVLDKDGLKPTARDPYLQMLNEHYIQRYLNKSDAVLDIGCGAGCSTVKFAKSVSRIVGMDYSDSLIKQAIMKKSENTEFIHGDVLELDQLFAKNTFDCVVSIRCLINLPDEAMQYRAVKKIFDVLKPGGLMLLSEGYQTGWDGINLHRQRNGLNIMKIVNYNNFFNNINLERALLESGSIIDFIGFGEYIYGSRVAHPLLAEGEIRHDSKINKVFSELQMNNASSRNYSECDYAGIYVVKKH